MEDNTAHTMHGAPAAIALEYMVPGENGSAVDISLVWRNKTATRLALSRCGSLSTQDDGNDDDPSVVEAALLRVETLDSPLVSPGDTKHMLRYNLRSGLTLCMVGCTSTGLHNNPVV